jgi:two-component system nitrogen regulation response regulator NtrX
MEKDMESQFRILLVDDDKSIRRSLQVALQNSGFEVHLAQDAQQALQALHAKNFDIAVVDVVLGEISGIDLLSRVRQQFPELPVIFMSGAASLTEVAKLMKLGASDFLEKPFAPEKLLLTIDRSLEYARLQNQVKYLQSLDVSGADQIYGESKPIRQVRELISRVAKTNAHVLVRGESGTGKELVAKQIHLQSLRSKEPFIKINCSAIPESLVESELFGHTKGAFTGAVENKKGYFELAHRGTLFLDEIGDMSLSAQAKILRALQSGEIQAVGADQVRKVDVRIIAATHKDLNLAVQNGQFREDLFFRINVIPVYLPPLRERAEDIALLAQKMIDDIALQNSYSKRTFSAEALQEISRFPWPGNIRELRNFLERLLILGGGLIQPADLEMSILGSQDRGAQIQSSGASLKDFKDIQERKYILDTLKSVSGNISKAAEILDIERTYLHRRIGQFNIEKREYL